MPSIQTLYSCFREQTLSSVRAESSVLAYKARLSHLEPLAEARFKKESVEKWLEKVRGTRSRNSARELVRLAKKFWLFGIENGAWGGINPFYCKEKERCRDEPSSIEARFLSPLEIRSVLERAPDRETHVFWACCALAGLRQSEAASLKYSNLASFDSKIVKIIDLPKRGTAPDYVDVSNELSSLLQSFVPPPPPLEVI